MKISFHSYSLLLIFSPLLLINCKAKTNATNLDTAPQEYKYYADWAINTDYMEPGCNGAECIKSLDNPVFISVNKVDFIEDTDLVIGLKIGNIVKCYPHAILNWHEIINDQFDSHLISLNYCPLTGSGMAWNRVINGVETEFGISGLLYNSNVIPYDRKTGSFWSQMKQECVNGAFYKQKIEQFQVIETSWATWKILFPDSKVVSTETGYSRDYTAYPYDDYRENETVYFNTEFDSDTLHQKERVFGITQNNSAKCYRFNLFKNGIGVLQDSIFNKKIVVIGSEADNFIVAFEQTLNGKIIQLTPIQNKLPGIVVDANENIFDVFGTCIEGNLKGAQLKPLNGFIAYWFAWAAFYPEVILQ